MSQPGEVDSRQGGLLRRGIATVCLSGTLEHKLVAAADAGFDGVEVFENDLIASPCSPTEVRIRCADLGLSVDLYQPFRDFDSVDAGKFARNLRRADRKFDVMLGLGTDTLLVCSSVSRDAVDDNDRNAEQLHTLADRAAARGLRIAYEALAWGRHVSTWDRSWEIARLADHPALGLCLDSFHILSRGSDPSGIADVPGHKLFFLQLADAPHLDMDVLQWSRHHRVFPGQGAFDLLAFLEHVMRAGYSGPLSLEVFNDVFRQADPGRTAVDAMRSLIYLEERLAAETPLLREQVQLAMPPPAPEVAGHAFTELAVDELSGPQVAAALSALGFTHTGQHRSKPVQLWQQGSARVLVNAAVAQSETPGVTAVSALAIQTADPPTSAARAAALLAPVLPRVRGVAEADLSAVAAPDGTQVFFARAGADWLFDFLPTGNFGGFGAGLTRVDHVALAQPFDHFDEAILFYRSVLGLESEATTEFAAPFGLVRSRAVTGPVHTVRIVLSVALLRRGGWAPGVPDPQHIAFNSDDLLATAQRLHAAGAPLVSISDNYYDDLDARLELDPALLAAMREHGILYDRDEHGEFLQLYTEVLGSRVFFEVVQRIGGYLGNGEANAPVRMAAHLHLRLTGESRGPNNPDQHSMRQQ